MKTKAEIIEKIIDRITDEWTEDCEDYADARLIDLAEATDYLAEYRSDDEKCGFTPEEDGMPAEATPELFMEAENCYIRYMKHELTVRRLAEWFTANEEVCIHDNYMDEYENKDPHVYPIDFLRDFDTSEIASILFGEEKLDILDIIAIAQRSSEFSLNHEYLWYDNEHKQLISSNTPFADGIIDAEAMARFFVDGDRQNLRDLILGYIDNDDCKHIFGKTEKEMTNNE